MTHRPSRLGEAGHRTSRGRLGNSPHCSLTVEQMAPLGKGRCAAEQLRDPRGEVQTSGRAVAGPGRAGPRGPAGGGLAHGHAPSTHDVSTAFGPGGRHTGRCPGLGPSAFPTLL